MKTEILTLNKNGYEQDNSEYLINICFYGKRDVISFLQDSYAGYDAYERFGSKVCSGVPDSCSNLS